MTRLTRRREGSVNEATARRRSLSWGAFTLSAVLAASGARAQVDANDGEYARAGQLRGAQRFEEALTIYRQLHEQTRAPRALAQLGVTEAQMGRWVPAEEHLRVALGTHDPWVERNRAVLQVALERTQQNVGDLTVACNVPGAELRVNGAPAGALPRAVRVPVGPVVIDVMAEGHEPHRQTVVTTARDTRVEVTLVTRVSVTVTPIAPAPVAVRSNPAQAVIVPAATRVTPVRRASPSGSGNGALRTLAWVGAAGSVALLGTGVAALVVGSGAASRWNDDAQCQRPGRTREEVCASERATAESMGTLAVVGFVGGGVLAAASAVLFVVSRPRGREPRTAVACGQGPGEFGLACGWRF